MRTVGLILKHKRDYQDNVRRQESKLIEDGPGKRMAKRSRVKYKR